MCQRREQREGCYYHSYVAERERNLWVWGHLDLQRRSCNYVQFHVECVDVTLPSQKRAKRKHKYSLYQVKDSGAKVEAFQIVE